jgi:outer membrane protein OmpA-like peptidoglycan-associated protein
MRISIHSLARSALRACAALCLLHALPARAQPGDSMRAEPPGVRLPARTATPSAGAQAPAVAVSPAKIYAACRHPDARQDRNVPLWNLCNRIVIPPGNLAFRPAALEQMAKLLLPTPAEIDRLSSEAETVRRRLPLLGGFLAATPEAPEIQFELSSARLDTAYIALIAAVAPEAIGHLERHPDARVVVTGFASPDGAAGTVNKDLAQQRARVVAAELVKRGVSAQRITITQAVPTRASLGQVVTQEEREDSRGATVAVEAPAIAFSAGVPRTRAGEALTGEAAAPALAADASAPAGSPSGLSLTMVANAATDVLVERASEQMQVYVVSQLSERLCDPAAQASATFGGYDLGPVAGYMRATCGLLTDGSVEVGTAGLGELRMALRRDLRDMPQTLGFRALTVRRDALGQIPRYEDAANVVLALLTFVDQVEEGAPPLRVIASFARDQVTGPGGVQWSLPVTDSARFPYTDGLRRFAHYASRLDAARTELAPYAADSWMMADTAFAYALRSMAVAYQASNRSDPHLTWLLDQGFAGADAALGAYRDVNAGMERIRAITARVDTLMSGGDATQATRQALYGEAVGVLASVAPALFMAADSRAEELRALVEPARQIVVSARTGRYGEAAFGLVDLVRAPGLLAKMDSVPEVVRLRTELVRYMDQARVLRDSVETLRRAVGGLAGGAAAQAQARIDALQREVQNLVADSTARSQAVQAALTSLRTATGFPSGRGEQSIMRVLSLTSSVVEARSEEQVAQALRVFVGQGRDFVSKREIGTSLRVALNAYVGLGGGGEWVEDVPDVDGGGAMFGSVFIPVGVEMSRPCGKGYSCGGFIPLVDLGAIAATRFGGGDDVDSAPEVELSRIITPGAYFVLGLPNKPLSLGIGGVYAPESRTLEVEGDEDDDGRELNALRLGFFIGIDIPLFP